MDRDKIEKGFRKWCYCAWLPDYHEPIFSIKYLSKNFFYDTEYKTRKLIKKLESMGYVTKNYEGKTDEEGYPHCYHGWSLTVKALDTEIGKEERKKVDQYIDNLISGDCMEDKDD